MKKLLIVFFCFIVGFVIGLLVEEHNNDQYADVIVRSDTIIRIDTFIVRVPEVRESNVVRYVTRYLPRYDIDAMSVGDESGSKGEIFSSSDGGIGYSKSSDETIIEDKPIQIFNTTSLSVEEPDNRIRDETKCDSVSVVLPIEQHVYGDDRYTAWISGYEASLDSILIYDRFVQIDNKSVVRTKKDRRWGCVAGVGVGAGSKGLTPTIGVTIGYRLF